MVAYFSVLQNVYFNDIHFDLFSGGGFAHKIARVSGGDSFSQRHFIALAQYFLNLNGDVGEAR